VRQQQLSAIISKEIFGQLLDTTTKTPQQTASIILTSI